MADEPQIDKNIDWKDALSGGKYVKFEDGDAKTITITNWGFYKKNNDKGEEVIGLRADVLEEDGKFMEKKGDRVLDTTSIRLKMKLKPILSAKQSTEKVRLQIVKVGDKKDTQFSVKEVPGLEGPAHQSKLPTQNVVKTMTHEEMEKKFNELKQLKANGDLSEAGYKMAMSQLAATEIKNE